MEELSFKTRVKNVVIEAASKYKNNYVNYEYLFFSSHFSNKIYIVTGTEENYLHLIGVHTGLKPKTFFEKCIKGELKEDNFDFTDKYGHDMKGTVRRKVLVLKNMTELMYHKELYVQEIFKKIVFIAQ